MIYPRFSEGIANVWERDRVSQEHYLSIIAETRGLPLDLFERCGAIFVPNSSYLVDYFGRDCAKHEYELYDYGLNCLVQGCVLFPCYTFSGNLIAWVVYNPVVKQHATETKDYSQNYYSYPSKLIWDKSRFLFTLPSVYETALRDGYIILTDGVFDTLSLISRGVNAGALLGSYVTPYNSFLLRFIPKVFVSVDNDEAGNKMLRAVKRLLPHAKAVRQGVGKDIDEILQSEHEATFLETLHTGISQNTDILFKTRY